MQKQVNFYNINQAPPYGQNDKTVAPMGLDFKQYLNNENDVVDQSKDGPIIDEALESNSDFMKIMQKRDKELKNLTSSWMRGNKSNVIQTIVSMNDIGIINSFVLYAIIKTDLKRIDIGCSDANNLFTAIKSLVQSKDQHHFLNGVLSTWVLLRLFEDVIISTKQSQQMGGGIDLNKEDKIRKYDVFISNVKQIRNGSIFLDYYKNTPKLEGVDLEKFAKEVDYFLKKCDF